MAESKDSLKPSKDPYAHRSHRQKYKLGYGAEGAARGKNELPGSKAESPKNESYEEADGKAQLKKQVSKTKPNPY